jgi:hypothetical protein
MTIFTELLRALDGSMGGQDRNILLFVNSCAARPQCTSILGNIKAACILFSCMTLLQNLDLGIMKYVGKLYIKQIVQKACWTQERMSQQKLSVLQAIHVRVEPWQLMTQKIM